MAITGISLGSLFRAAAKALLRPATVQDQDAADSGSARGILESAFRLHQSGRMTDALALYRRAIVFDPGSDVAHNLLGTLLCAQGNLVEGEACFKRATELNRSNFEACNNLANVRKEQGDPAAAEQLYRRTLGMNPRFAPAWNNLGLLHVQLQRLDDAAECFRQVLAVNPAHADAHNNLGAVLRMQGRLTDAENEFRATLDANPEHAEAWCGLGDVLPLRGLLDEAEICCQKALELRPGYPDATNNLATIAKLRGRLDVAKAYCNDVLGNRPDHIGALNNLGSIAAKQADYVTAERIYRSALEINPGHTVTRFNLATTLLMLGNYSEGFEFYESRFEAFQRPFTQSSPLNEKLSARPRWRGEPLGGKRLLVWAEQGLGDCIMMLRYLPQLHARGVDSVTVLCDGALERLVGRLTAVEEVLSVQQVVGAALEFDVHCPIMSLPWTFGTRLETIPSNVPYLAVPEAMIAEWRARLTGSRPKIGVAWAGSRTLEDDARRSIPLEQFAPLLFSECIQFVSLQRGEAAQEWRKTGREGGQFIEACGDLLDTAAVIMNLDLVISVDTAVAHLAGALGRPVLLLNRFGSEWRWGLEGDASTWYPTMTIFREHARDQWAAAIERMASYVRLRFGHQPNECTIGGAP